jgi:3D-(3,5/4)-trihydroxycyclohexane-1,2-dione acylhydrolase (decyclizing)
VRTVRLTAAQAIVRHLAAQRTIVDGEERPLVPGVFAIFGHGNVTGLGVALEEAREILPTIRGQNEQGMALAATAFAKAMRRRQIMACATSVGPGALNMVTAAGVAHANRLPVLMLSGDAFASRIPDPVLQQVEHFGAPSATVNDAFRPVTRFWDRIVRPEQVLQSLPAAIATMLDPADCGPAFLGLAQDAQAEAYDYPERFFAPTVHEARRQRPDRREVEAAAAALREARRPLVIVGGGVRYSLAEEALARFLSVFDLPAVETVAGKSCLPADHPRLVGPIGVSGAPQVNRLAAEADVVLAMGTRLQDFTTGSWTVFGQEDLRIVALNAARFDATKHRSLPVVGDAREGLAELERALEGWRADPGWSETARTEADEYRRWVDRTVAPDRTAGQPSYAQIIGAVNRLAGEEDYVVASAGGLPGELNVNWRAKGLGTFDCEYGFSCMGYEIAGAWGARMARPHGEVLSFCGDGSYLMMNSDLYSSVLSGHKLTVILCDNRGYACIERLQVDQGGAPFNNMIASDQPWVDWVAHATAMGCRAERVSALAELEAALERARSADRTSVVVIDTAPDVWTGGGAFWQVGVAEVSHRPEVSEAHAAMVEGLRRQRVGW